MWTVILLLAALGIGVLLGKRYKGESFAEYSARPSIHDERCPVCAGRIPGPIYGTVDCPKCKSSWLAGDFGHQGQLVCSDCGDAMVKRIQDPYDDALYQVTFKCGRIVAAYMQGEKREQAPCTKTREKQEEGPEKSKETVPSTKDVSDHEEMTFTAEEDMEELLNMETPSLDKPTVKPVTELLTVDCLTEDMEEPVTLDVTKIYSNGLALKTEFPLSVGTRITANNRPCVVSRVWEGKGMIVNWDD